MPRSPWFLNKLPPSAWGSSPKWQFKQKKRSSNSGKQLELIVESFYDLTENEQISSFVQIAFSIGTIEKCVSISQNILNNVNFLPVVTSEADLEETGFFLLTFGSEIKSHYESYSSSDTDAEFQIKFHVLFISTVFYYQLYISLWCSWKK